MYENILSEVKKYWITIAQPKMVSLSITMTDEELIKECTDLILIGRNKSLDGLDLEFTCADIPTLSIGNKSSVLRPFYKRFMTLCKTIVSLKTKGTDYSYIQKLYCSDINCLSEKECIDEINRLGEKLEEIFFEAEETLRKE